jgi:hypothetical protein
MAPVNRRKLAYGLGCVLALLGHGIATAQQPGPDAPVETTGGRQVRLSPTEQLDQARGFVGAMERIRDGIRRELEEARTKGDVVKKLCLDDKLNQLDIALRKASEREKALENAVKVNDSELSNHEFTILSVLNQRANSLDAEAKLCIGKEVVSVGDSATQMNIEGTLPGEEQTVGFPTPAMITEPPACASCFR